MQYNHAPTERELASPASSLSFSHVQHNCLGSWAVFLSLFSSFSQLAHRPSIVALQDPPVYRGKLPSFQLFTSFAPPVTGNKKPRVAFYVFSSFLDSIVLLPRFFDRGDIMALDLFTPDGFFDRSLTSFTFINSYSTKGRSNNTRSVPPDLIFPSSPSPTLTLGDLNIDHPTADPNRSFKEDEIATSASDFNRATQRGFSLLNSPRVYIRFSMSLIGRPGVLDLAFAGPLLMPYFSEWSDPLPSTGSYHIPILLCFNVPFLRAPPLRPNWTITDWPRVSHDLKTFTIPTPPALPISHSMGVWFDPNITKISATLALHTPLTRVTHRSKPWWLVTLLELRRAYNSTLRASKKDRQDSFRLLSAWAACSSYFKAIKKAKRDHWCEFLATATQAVWTAKKFAIGRPPLRFPELPGASTPHELNAALLEYIFPGKPADDPCTILLSFRAALLLDASEVDRALARSSPSSAPGPDMIPNSVWKRINKMAPNMLLRLLAPLVSHGFHTPSLKKAQGIVLDKPGKPSYDSPYSFRVIILLKTFLKIHERIMNSCLSCVARVVGLLNLHQCGSRAGLSVSDTCNTLTHEIRTLQMDKRKVSTLFLDLKGHFNNVNPSSLCGMLSARGVNPDLVAWTRFFLMGRSCRLLYQGSPKACRPVSVGTPQGSPVSPLLFVIYVAGLHKEIPLGLTLSYVDDFALTFSSESFRCNMQLLQKHYAILKAKGSRLGVGFSIPKTELIYWRTNRDRDPPSLTPICLDRSVCHPKSELRWLSLWFIPSLSTTLHFNKRFAKAQAAFVAVKRFSPLGMGLPHFLCHRLAACLLFPILSYGGKSSPRRPIW